MKDLINLICATESNKGWLKFWKNKIIVERPTYICILQGLRINETDPSKVNQKHLK